MQNNSNILVMMVTVGLALPLIITQLVYSQGIILANNREIIDIFRSHQSTPTRKLVENLEPYDRIILHLGAGRVFRRGSAFFYRSSQKNLKLFCKLLTERDKQIYLWFLDSFGSKEFGELYENYQAIIDDNHLHLQQLDLSFTGIIIDLEWINLHTKSDNSNKYLEILAYLEQKFGDKEIYSFAPIIDNRQENTKRGYRINQMFKFLDGTIPMFYLKDGGFYLEDDQLQLYLNDDRIEDLRNYYQQSQFPVAVSLQQGIILQRGQQLYFVQTTDSFPLKYSVKRDYIRQEKYYTITGYSPDTNFKITRDDGIDEHIQQSDKLHFFQIKTKELLKKDDYIWEYFMLKDNPGLR